MFRFLPLLALAVLAAPAASAQDAPTTSVFIIINYECNTAGLERALELYESNQPLLQELADEMGGVGYGVMGRAYGGGSEIIVYFVGPTMDAVQAYGRAFSQRVWESRGSDVEEFYSLCPQQTESFYFSRVGGGSVAPE